MTLRITLDLSEDELAAYYYAMSAARLRIQERITKGISTESDEFYLAAIKSMYSQPATVAPRQA